MNTTDLAYFKGKLEAEKEEILKELGGIATQIDGSDSENWQGKEPELNIQEADDNEVADELEEFANNTEITEEIETRLREVNAALELIAECEDGGECKYGIDKFDGEPIERDRLEANPAAQTRIANKDRV